MVTTNSDRKAVQESDLPGYYYWLSECYAGLNQVNQRMAALDSCYTVGIRIGYLDLSVTAALYRRGEHAFDLGDYHQCISYMNRCGAVANQPGPYPEIRRQYTSSSLLWQVKALLQLGQYQDAERLLNNRIDECMRSGAINNLGTIYSQFAELEIRKGNFDQALSFYNRSFANDQSAGNFFNCKQTLKDIGYNIYFLHFSNYAKALACYFRALRVVNKDPSRKDEDLAESLDIYRLIANVYAGLRQFDLTYHYFQLAYQQVSAGLNEDNILGTTQAELLKYRKVHYVTSLIIDQADAYRSQFEMTHQRATLDKAVRIYKTADQLLDKIKLEQYDLDSKLFWRSDTRRLYQHAIDAGYQGDNVDDAFYFFEKGRAVLLNDQLNERTWLAETDIMKESQLERRAMDLERKLSSTEKSSKQYSELERELFANKQDLQNLQQSIKAKNPLYYQSFLDKGHFITLKDVQQSILNDHQALVELFDGDSAVYVLTITARKSYLQKINKSVFDSLSVIFVKYISHSDLLNKKFDILKNLSFQLYQLLFQNIDLPPGRIIISPDGKYFPFEALVTNIQPLSYFLDDHAVSYTYSARYLLNTFNSTASQHSQTFLGIAPVNFTSFPQLSGSDESLTRLRNYFSQASYYYRENASRNNFLNEFYKYKIIQLYTHATDSGYGGEPMIYFSDSTLNLSDLLPEQKPATDLIVLSACETASGKLHSGEGVFSFNRGFAALGIPSCVSNLWEVDNKSTYRLTELFYKHVADGLPLDVALQSAKEEFRKTAVGEEKLPYYWAAPILVGKTDAIVVGRKFAWQWVAIISSLAVVGLVAWRFRRKNPTKFQSARTLPETPKSGSGNI